MTPSESKRSYQDENLLSATTKQDGDDFQEDGVCASGLPRAVLVGGDVDVDVDDDGSGNGTYNEMESSVLRGAECRQSIPPEAAMSYDQRLPSRQAFGDEEDTPMEEKEPEEGPVLSDHEADSENLEFYFGSVGRKKFFNAFMSGNTARGALGDVRDFSARTLYLQNCINRGLVPDPLIIRKRPCFKMEYQYFGMGNDYVLAFGESLATIPHTSIIDLRNNCIRSDGIASLCKGLIDNENQVKELNLSGNALEERGASHLSGYLSSRNCVLYTLRLEGCSLGRKGARALCAGLRANRSLCHLSLSRNGIDGDSASAMCVALSSNPFLRSLELAWNDITGYGAASFARSLQINDTLTFVDISYNGFGTSPNSAAMQSLSCLLTANNIIEHISIARNQISYQDMKILERGLRNNFTIKGIHVGGNDGHIDAKGFLHPGKISELEGFDHMQDIPEPLCWVCSNYQEALFTFTPGVSIDASAPIQSIALRLEVDRFLPDPMVFNSTTRRYELHRMVPAGNCRYLFSVNKDQEATAQDQWTTHDPSLPFVELNIREVPVDDPEVPALCRHAHPRSTASIEPEVSVDLLKRRRAAPPVWQVSMSLMGGRGSENDSKKAVDPPEALESAFLGDWGLVDFGRMIKDERKLEAVRDAWRDQYGLLRSTFQWYACRNDTPMLHLSLSDFQDVIYESEVNHPRLMTMKQVEAVWVESFRENKEIENPKLEWIGRPKFMELLTRVSIARFSTKKKGIKANDAVTKIMEEYINPKAKHVDPLPFRSLLCSKDYDDIIRSYMPVLQGVFRELSSPKVPKSSKAFIEISRFQEVIDFVHFVDEGLEYPRLRPVRQCYLQSKCLVFDEVKSAGRHLYLTLYEFVEALCRYISGV